MLTLHATAAGKYTETNQMSGQAADIARAVDVNCCQAQLTAPSVPKQSWPVLAPL